MTILLLNWSNLCGQINYKVKYTIGWGTLTNLWKDTTSVERVISYNPNGKPWEIKTEFKNGHYEYDSGFVTAKGMLPVDAYIYVDKMPGYIAHYSRLHSYNKQIWVPSSIKKGIHPDLTKHHYDKRSQDTLSLSAISVSNEIPDTNIYKTKYDDLNRLLSYTNLYQGNTSSYRYLYTTDNKNRITEVEQSYFDYDKKGKLTLQIHKKVDYKRNNAGEIENATVYRRKKENWQPISRYTYTWYRYDLKNETNMPFFVSENDKNLLKGETEETWDTINKIWNVNSHSDIFYSRDSLDTFDITTRNFSKTEHDTSLYIRHYYPNKDLKEVKFYKQNQGKKVRMYMDDDSGMNYELENSYLPDGRISISIYKSPSNGILKNRIKVVYAY